MESNHRDGPKSHNDYYYKLSSDYKPPRRNGSSDIYYQGESSRVASSARQLLVLGIIKRYIIAFLNTVVYCCNFRMSRTPEYKAFDSCQTDGYEEATDSGYEHRTSPGNAIDNIIMMK